MKKLRYVITMLLLLISFYTIFRGNSVAYALDIEVMAPAKAMVVIEGNTNTTLYGFNENIRLPMASTTKIATAILAIENTEDLDKKIDISDKAIGIEGTSIYLKSGEKLSMRELLYGLILASGNDCAVAIAESFGSEETFVDMMNNFVLSLGLENTHFDNPHGLDSDTHFTSALDLAKITSYALKNDIFKEIVSTERYVIEGSELYPARYLKHKNKLLFTDENCIGVKTGFTDNAGRCLVNATEKDGMQVISVVLNCGPMFEECQRLDSLAYENYKMKEFVKPYNYVSSVNIDGSDKTQVGVITVEGYSDVILKSEESLYDVKYYIEDSVKAPIKLNQQVGYYDVLKGNDVIYTGSLISIESADSNEIKHYIDEILGEWF